MTSSVPDVESDGAVVGVEDHGVNLHSESGNVLLFKLSSEMALNEGGLADTSVTNEN